MTGPYRECSDGESKGMHLGSSEKTLQYLPLDIATESLAIVARKGAGKTHTARVIAEGLITHHIQVVIVDPLDVWWGIRSSADGRREGLGAIIFGGTHADLPLLENAGTALADLIVDKGISAVLVLDHLTQGAQRRFMADFGTRLYERKSEPQHRTPLHLIIDEADAFVPQKVFPEGAKCHGAVDRIVRRGRSRGIGTTVITQRPAVISKDVLTQTEILISLQVTAPQDRKALQEWIDANATKEQKATYLAELPTMQRGEAFVWSPAKLKCFYKCQVRATLTFDSSFTPKVGVGSKGWISPTLKDLDLTAIKRDLDAVVQQAEATDPKKLQERIEGMQRANALIQREKDNLAQGLAKVQERLDKANAYVLELEEQVKAARGASNPPSPHFVAQELMKRDKHWRLFLERAIGDGPGYAGGSAEAAAATAEKAYNTTPATPPPAQSYRYTTPGRATLPMPPTPRTSRERATGTVERLARAAFEGASKHTGEKLPKAEKLILTVLMQATTQGVPKERVAAIAGYSPNGGGFNNAIGALKSKVYIYVDGGSLYATEGGKSALGSFEHLPTGHDLLRYWVSRVGKAEGLILSALFNAQAGLSKDALATNCGYAPDGGGFNNALGALRTKGLIEGSKMITLAEDLRA